MTEIMLARYAAQQCVKDRNLGSLLRWAAYITTQPIPTEQPPVEIVRLRIVAERIPAQPDSYVVRTMAYFQQDPATAERLVEFMNPFNDEAAETVLGGANADIIGTFMPRFAAADVSEEQVEQWYRAHGFES